MRLKILFFIILFIPKVYSQSSNYSIGSIPLDSIKKIEDFKWLESRYNNFKPNKNILDKFNGNIEEYSVKVFIGTWCGDSKSFFPKFLKSLEYLGVENESIELFGINRKKDEPKLLVESFNIKFVPTAIFYKKGREINRIVEYPQENVEQDIIDILIKEKEYIPFHPIK
ncbi:thioredoxin family protein [Galbibacter sp. BG1]|uniref:thioredoxin family protein n=1 Tax=Galbibacter sp. BG1 TaxID=1170699 RepID=UPI0015B83886|nr:thioredoxin family protein [Galbibacter sp. BG1]QLE02728.1 thioredoxin family protein [Galbibacter sp. BG1]